MDLLSRLLSLMPVSGRLEIRCHFGAPWAIEEETAGMREIPYHVLLSGTAVVEDDNGPAERIGPGDIVLFPTGSAHRIHDGSGKSPKPAVERRNESLLIVESGAPGVTADLLCGRFLVGAVPDRLLRDHLPGRLVVHSTPQHAQHAHHAATGIDTNQSIASPGAGTRLTRLIELMREEATDQGPGSETLVNHLSAALFGLTLRFATEASAPHGLLALAGRPRLQPAVIAMFDKPGEPWTLDQFAALCNMSRATFVRQFQEAIGRSATDVLTEVRMTVAGRLLIQTTRPVAEIGETVGYQSDAAFQRIFKRHTGITPSRWRTSGGNVPARQADEAEMDSAES
jgi:AraC family transcriptional regulator, activator of mtrCDE